MEIQFARAGQPVPIRRAAVLFALVASTLAGPLAPALAKAPRPQACRVANALTLRGYLDAAATQAQAAIKERRSRACGMEELLKVRTKRARRAAEVSAQLRQAGLGAAAIKALETRLTTGDAPAIRNTLVALEPAAHFAIAQALIEAGFLDAGAEALRDKLKDPPGSLPVNDLAAVRKRLETRRIAVAEALEDLGEHEAAVDEIEKAVLADPEVDVPYNLRNPDRRLDWWRATLGAVGPWVRTVAEILLLAFGMAAFVIAMRRLVRRRHRRLELGEVTGDDKGGALAQGLREQFGRLKDHHGGHALHCVGPAGDVYAISAEVSKAFPTAGIVMEALNALNRQLPANRWRITATTGDAGGGQGAVATLAITRQNGRVHASETFRLRDFRWCVPAGAGITGREWHRLALPAAVWLTFQAGKPGPDGRFVALGTSDWRSYALFAVGADVTGVVGTASRRRFAKRLYLDALELDPRNQGAALNLARLEMIDAARASNATSARLRASAVCRLRTLVAAVSDDSDLFWYRARYLLMSAYLADGRHQDAYDIGAELVRTMLSVPRHGRDRQTLRDFLAQNEGPAMAGLACASAAALIPGETVAAAPSLERLRERLEGPLRVSHTHIAALARDAALNARTHYNLACYAARVGSQAPDVDLEHHLRAALALGGPNLADEAKIDPDLELVRALVVELAAEESGPRSEPRELIGNQ